MQVLAHVVWVMSLDDLDLLCAEQESSARPDFDQLIVKPCQLIPSMHPELVCSMLFVHTRRDVLPQVPSEKEAVVVGLPLACRLAIAAVWACLLLQPLLVSHCPDESLVHLRIIQVHALKFYE